MRTHFWLEGSGAFSRSPVARPATELRDRSSSSPRTELGPPVRHLRRCRAPKVRLRPPFARAGCSWRDRTCPHPWLPWRREGAREWRWVLGPDHVPCSLQPPCFRRRTPRWPGVVLAERTARTIDERGLRRTEGPFVRRRFGGFGQALVDLSSGCERLEVDNLSGRRTQARGYVRYGDAWNRGASAPGQEGCCEGISESAERSHGSFLS